MDAGTVVTSSGAQRYRAARGGGPLDRVDQLVAPDGEIEVDVEGPAATQSVGCARVRLGDVVWLTGRSAVRSEPVLVRHRHGRQGLLAFARVHLVRSEAERAVRPDDDGAVSPVDLRSVAARIRGRGGHADRDLGAADHAADDVDAVRRIDGNRLASSVRHSGIRVDTRAESSANSPSTAHSASMACPPVMVSTLAPLARTPCQMRPGPRCRWASATVVKFAVSTSPM